MAVHARARGSGRWSGAVVLGLTTAFAALVALAVTGSLSWMFGAAAVDAVLVGSAVASGVFDRRAWPRRIDELLPDGRTAALAEYVLGSLDGIEYRRVELGAPWPQLCVGPTGVLVVDVCGIEGPVCLDASGVRRCDDRDRCRRCDAALDAGAAARRALAPSHLGVPVRTIAVVAAGTAVRVADDAPSDASLITVDELADALARGPVLAMSVVDASFALLSRTAMEPGTC